MKADARPLSSDHLAKLRALAEALLDQPAARVIVPPHECRSGFWFGGGNLTRDHAGAIWLTGRYRNAGDARTGTKAGERGLECAVLRSDDAGRSFTEVKRWTKAELSTGGAPVLSIEGTALRWRGDGRCELFISTEKQQAYPEAVASHQKPGTGVWSIDVMTGNSPDAMDGRGVRPALSQTPPVEYLHVKDPVVFEFGAGRTVLVFCTHPYCWSSGNSGYAIRDGEDQPFALASWEMVSRGPAWDVAATRITNRLPVPRVGAFRDLPLVSIYFYDGAECLRPHEANPHGAKRPRGYSCEELGGVMVGVDADFPAVQRLSRGEPLFVSPHGTGCSRYVDALALDAGILSTWQQSQDDGSQPLVLHFVEMDRVEKILS